MSVQREGVEQVTDAAARVPTMFDVAKLAGVSHQTVSRVLNDLPNVSGPTRARVEQAIAELHYAPSQAARAMATRRSRSIGLIQAGRPDYGPSNAALGFNEAARAAHYTVSQASIREPDDELLEAAVRMMMRQRVEAVVIISGERALSRSIRRLRFAAPLVMLASEPIGPAHRVSMDQYTSGRIAVEHLVSIGHREIRHLAGPDDSMDAAERTRAWRDVLAEHGLPEREPLVGDWQSASGFRHGRDLAADVEATAVFASNDQMALGLLHAYREAGVRVPDDVSVIAFDDIPEAAHFAPPMTTMRQDFDALGRDIMATVLEVLQSEASAADRTGRVAELVLRASTAPPRR